MMLEYEPVEKSDWEYDMRREMQLIVPGVYLGPFSAATKSQFEELLKHEITHIICIRHQVESRFIHPNFSQHLRYLVVEIADEPCANILKHFSTTYSFIEEALCSGGKVLVHGNNGISRREAYTWVRDRRCCIMPNSGFLDQLKEYEPIYKAMLMNTEIDFNENDAVKKKRSIEDLQ